MKTILLIVGVAFSKLFPILFGAYLIRNFGKNQYSSFVLLIAYCNALMALSIMGVVPSILRASLHIDPLRKIRTLAIASFIILLVSIGVSEIYWRIFSVNPLLPLINEVNSSILVSSAPVVLYCLGAAFLAIASAKCNHESNNHYSGIGSILVGGLAMLSGVSVGQYFENSVLSVLAFSAGYFLFGAIFYYIIFNTGKYKIYLVSNNIHWASVPSEFGNILKASCFGILALATFYLINRGVHLYNSISEIAIFSLGFQLFTISIFLPSVLGNALVPRLVKDKSNKPGFFSDIEKNSFISYFLIGFGWISVVALLLSSVLDYYGIEITADSKRVVMLMQVCAILAGINAVFNQKFVAEGRFALLAILYGIWSSVAFLGCYLAGYRYESVSTALIAAYTLMIFASLLWIYSRPLQHFFKRSNEI